AHPELLVTRHAELADDEDVEGGAERARHLVADGDTAARQGEHDDVGTVAVASELGREQTARVGAIMEARGRRTPDHARLREGPARVSASIIDPRTRSGTSPVCR